MGGVHSRLLMVNKPTHGKTVWHMLKICAIYKDALKVFAQLGKEFESWQKKNTIK